MPIKIIVADKSKEPEIAEECRKAIAEIGLSKGTVVIITQSEQVMDDEVAEVHPYEYTAL